jgi:hypothetical protein
MVEKGRRKGTERNSGIKERGARQQLHQRKDRTSCRINRKAVELEIEKGIVMCSTELWESTRHFGGFGLL